MKNNKDYLKRKDVDFRSTKFFFVGGVFLITFISIGVCFGFFYLSNFVKNKKIEKKFENIKF